MFFDKNQEAKPQGIRMHVYHFLPASSQLCHKLRFVGHISIEWEQKKLAWH